MSSNGRDDLSLLDEGPVILDFPSEVVSRDVSVLFSVITSGSYINVSVAASLLNVSRPDGSSFVFFYSEDVCEAKNHAVKAFINSDHTHMFMSTSTILVPSDVIPHFLSVDADIVTGLYLSKEFDIPVDLSPFKISRSTCPAFFASKEAMQVVFERSERTPFRVIGDASFNSMVDFYGRANSYGLSVMCSPVVSFAEVCEMSKVLEYSPHKGEYVLKLYEME